MQQDCERNRRVIRVSKSGTVVASMIGDEAIVYDRRTSRIHRLDRLCTAVWQALEGDQTVTDLTKRAGLDDNGVTLTALAMLADAGLLEGNLGTCRTGDSSSRRRFIRKAALAGAIPAIVSVTAPGAAMATSVCTFGQTIPDPTCCTRFYWCQDGNWALTGCAPELRYDVARSTCDFYLNVNCGSRPATC